MEKFLEGAEDRPSISYSQPSTSIQDVTASSMSASSLKKEEKLYAYCTTLGRKGAVLMSVNPSGQPVESA